ncbi:type II toxin-antitoxin system PemK/MazF family toxin [Oscillatoria salina]|uniref:type II toxin-antitoxin system PemK/MazF family toxin n=1 Tax=Oscillatoria salina TaxID=331517 RepID=UPI001CCF75B3|nr:type II toxin-antitoxin system PemK/MazF family toxin [Oscillatoria salina]
MKKSGNKKYTPNRGDIVWLDFNPRTGRKQAGHRPAIETAPIFVIEEICAKLEPWIF